MAETRNPFKPLGTRLRDFARGKISRYVPVGESSSGKTAAPSWASSASAPLDWGDQSPATPQAGPAELPNFETHTERTVPVSFLGASSNSQPATPTPQAAADPAPKPKPMSRLDFLNFIWTKREEQLHSNRPAPAESSSADSGNIQRSADGEAAPPKPIGRRRRGAVVDVPTPRSPETPTESGNPDSSESPDFFFVGEDSSPDAPVPPSVQAMRASGDAALATPQVQRSSAPSEDASLPESSPWSSFTAAPTSSFNTSPAAPDAVASSETNTAAHTAAQPVSNPSVQRRISPAPAASATDSAGESSGILYMPADHVTRSESPASSQASPASPSIQRTSAEADSPQVAGNVQSHPSAAPSIQPARVDSPADSGNVPYIPDAPTPSVQLQRDSQPVPTRSRSGKSKAAQSPATRVESSAAESAAYTPAPSPSVQRQTNDAASSPMPDAPTLLTPSGSEAAAAPPYSASPSANVQRSSDPQAAPVSSQPTSYAGLPDSAFNAPLDQDSSSESLGGIVTASQAEAPSPVSSAPSQPSGTVQRKKSSAAASVPASSQPPASSSMQTVGESHAEPAEPTSESSFTAEAPTLLTPSVQRSSDYPAPAAAPSISRYADVPDAAFNTPAFAADAPTQLESHTSPPAQGKPTGSIQRRRGGMGVSYSSSESASDHIQRDLDENAANAAAPIPAWTPSTELAPPQPPSFAAPSPWETYMEAPEFSEPPNPVPRSKSGSAASNAAPTPPTKSSVQRKADAASAGAPNPQSQFSSLPDSSFMSSPDAPTSGYSPQNADAPAFSPPLSASPASSTAQISNATTMGAAASPPTISRYTEPGEASSDASSLPIHEFDVFEALSNNFTDPPQHNAQPSYSHPSPATNAPSISRSADTSASTSAPSQQFSHNFTPEANVPAPGSVEADMLQLLNLPPTTPVAGLKQAPATPEINRMPAVTPSETQHFSNYAKSVPSSASSSSSASAAPAQTTAPSPSLETSTPVVQRAASGEQPVSRGESSQNQPAGDEKGAPEQDIDGLAREVYKVLRTKLRTEHERRSGH